MTMTNHHSLQILFFFVTVRGRDYYQPTDMHLITELFLCLSRVNYRDQFYRRRIIEHFVSPSEVEISNPSENSLPSLVVESSAYRNK